MARAGGLIDLVALGEEVVILAGVALVGGDEAQGAMLVDMVVPGDELFDPLAGVVEVLEGFFGIPGPVLEGPEQALGVGVIVADRRSGEGGHDAQLLQGGVQGGALHGAAVIRMQHQSIRVHGFDIYFTI